VSITKTILGNKVVKLGYLKDRLFSKVGRIVVSKRAGTVSAGVRDNVVEKCGSRIAYGKEATKLKSFMRFLWRGHPAPPLTELWETSQKLGADRAH
jgi:hypothetical protein